MAFTLEELEAKLKANPFAREFFELASAYQKLGRIEDAKKVCEKGLEKFPGNFQARLLMTQIYIAEGKFPTAKQQVDKVLLVVPDNITANHLAADISYSLGDKATALRFYKVVELFEPGRQGVGEKILEIEGNANPAVAESKPIEKQELPSPEEQESIAEDAHQPEPFIPAPEPMIMDEAEAPAVLEKAEEPLEEADLMPPETGIPSESALTEYMGEGSFSPQEDPAEEIGDDTLDSLLSDTQQPEEKPYLQDEAEQLEVEPASPQESATSPSAKELEGEESASLSTMTIAELYEQQGYPEKAIEVYQHVLLKEPERKDTRAKIEKLKGQMLGLTPEGDVVGRDIKSAIRKKRIEVLGTWLRKIKEEGNV
jgi:tetratricopeptide (TPR) repeat protein